MDSGLHHVEIWVADLDAGRDAWGWLLERLGWTSDQTWPEGQTWTVGDTYIVVTRPPTLDGSGWVSLYADRYPHAGGEDHYAAYLQNAAGFKVEVVAADIR
ncbi:MAG TPA: glyoxalase [Glaciihabitans sp.]|jgi:hypothetical protein|nr:glyoxalase [Glaciihabitans sp.]